MNKPYIIIGVAVLLITSLSIITQEHTEAVYLFSPQCPVCQQVSPSVDKYLIEHPGTPLERINVNSDKGNEITNKNNIKGVPVAIINGEQIYYYGDKEAFIKQIDYRLQAVSK